MTSRERTAETTVWPWLALFALGLVTLLNDVRIEKVFSADGAAYFYWILDDRRFTTFAWSRNHAVYLTEWPLVWAVRANITDLSWLKAFYGAGFLFPHLLGFGLCVVARRGLPKWPLLFPIASLLTVNVSADYLLVGEHHAAAALAWPILFFAIRPSAYAAVDIALITALLAANTRLYESAVVTGVIFAVLFLTRTWRIRDQRAVLVGFAVLALVSTGIAASAIFSPRDGANRESFLGALAAPLANAQFLLALGFLGPCLVSIWRHRDRWAWAAVAVMVIVIVAAHTIVGSAAMGYRGGIASLSYASRTLSITFLPVLIVAAAYMSARPGRFVCSSAQVRAFAVFVLAAVAVNVYEGRHWAGFRDVFKETLRSESGFIALEQTPLANHPCAWAWNNAILSYLWSGGNVRTIILNPAEAGWQPFNPRATRILSDYVQGPAFVQTK